MPTLRLPAFVPINWLADEPVRFVAIRDATYAQFAAAFYHEVDRNLADAWEALLKALRRAPGTAETPVGVRLKLPPPRPLLGAPKQRYVPRDRAWLSDREFARKYAR